MARVEFPAGFRWGAATASYQIEGAHRADGKGESIWDRFAHTPGRIANGDTGDRACQSYERMDEDLALIGAMNLNSYRFSISWPRIQPDGHGAANQKGIDYYRSLVERLLAAGVRPFPTLYHWDLPQALEDAGGWPNRDTAGRFTDYADLVSRALGDVVSDWLIFNEPSIFTVMGYLAGIHAPGRRNLDDTLRAGHVVNLAHGGAFRTMKANHANSRIGSAFSMSPTETDGDSDADAEAAERFHGFMNYWYLQPALEGRYPDAFPDGLPAEVMGIEEGDMEQIQVPLDVVGINLYNRTLVRAGSGGPAGLDVSVVGPSGGNDGPRTDFGWEVWPDALHDMVMRVTRDFDAPEIEVTENGCSYDVDPDERGVVHDGARIDFFRGYLEALSRSIEEGARVVGYHAWTLMDNFEWSEGYGQRFGLAWVDFESGERRLKESGRWYGRVAAENGFVV